MAINQNELARRVTLRDAGKIKTGIGEVKEILRLTLEELAVEKPSEVLALVEKHAPVVGCGKKKRRKA